MNTPAIPGLAAPVRRVPARLRHGRPILLAARVLAVLALAQITLHAGAGPAPQAGVLAGITTWLILTARADPAPISSDAHPCTTGNPAPEGNQNDRQQPIQ